MALWMFQLCMNDYMNFDVGRYILVKTEKLVSDYQSSSNHERKLSYQLFDRFPNIFWQKLMISMISHALHKHLQIRRFKGWEYSGTKMNSLGSEPEAWTYPGRSCSKTLQYFRTKRKENRFPPQWCKRLLAEFVNWNTQNTHHIQSLQSFT